MFYSEPGRESNRGPQDWETEILPLCQCLRDIIILTRMQMGGVIGEGLKIKDKDGPGIGLGRGSVREGGILVNVEIGIYMDKIGFEITIRVSEGIKTGKG